MFLRLATLLILLFSSGAYAIPILQVNAAGAPGEVYFSKYHGGDMSRSETDEMLISVNPLWNGDIDRNNLLSGAYSSVFTLLYGFNPGFVTQFPRSDPAGFTLLGTPMVDVTEIDGTFGPSGEADDLTDFLATLGIAIADWQVADENSHAVSPQDPGPATPAITRQSAKNECLQPHYEHSQKPGSRESLCAGGSGVAGAAGGGGGGGGGVGSRDGLGAVAGRASRGHGMGGPGIGSPGIGGGPGTSSNGPGISTGAGTPNGHSGDSGSGGSGVIGELRTVPEPTTLALIAFGIASLCTVRRRKK